MTDVTEMTMTATTVVVDRNMNHLATSNLSRMATMDVTKSGPPATKVVDMKPSHRDTAEMKASVDTSVVKNMVDERRMSTGPLVGTAAKMNPALERVSTAVGKNQAMTLLATVDEQKSLGLSPAVSLVVKMNLPLANGNLAGVERNLGSSLADFLDVKRNPTLAAEDSAGVKKSLDTSLVVSAVAEMSSTPAVITTGLNKAMEDLLVTSMNALKAEVTTEAGMAKVMTTRDRVNIDDMVMMMRARMRATAAVAGILNTELELPGGLRQLT
ncbi:hypothetical protein A1O1_00201 [Capronia coronata CBS 617.96]|uniref:Uncharacterized protein n=1 Tax=Capronia coronata CBS 617.96 TaxID=1182541 RepID=W9YRA3_9EURO|nr:uncharacterized protein A1O1_00201 [Capronia coronata CBS 617.96]EXJ95083.1 hypothetical protein A1O1_00201 [Capronia coronata CBS 617.96]